jgi:hypothetical protein
MSLDGRLFMDPTGNTSERELAGGASEVLAAGRIVVSEGRVLVVTNESPAYTPSFAQMKAAVARLDAMGLDLTGDGAGVFVIVYAKLGQRGRGKHGKRYRAQKAQRVSNWF